MDTDEHGFWEPRKTPKMRKGICRPVRGSDFLQKVTKETEGHGF